MGYYASGEGTLKINKENPLTQDNIETLANVFEIADADAEDVDETGELFVSFSGNYHEDDVLETLNEIVDHITEGRISFSGDDDIYFAIIYQQDSGIFTVQDGKVVYEGELPFTESEKKVVADALAKLGTDDAAEIIRKYNLIFVGGENNENV